MLNEIRELVHPLFSTVPEPEVSRKTLRKNIKFTTVEPTRAGRRALTRNKDKENDAYDTKDLPYPVISYGHAKGCIYSDTPDVVIKSADAVKAMDDDARTRLANINALLAADVDFIDADLDFSKGSRSSTSHSTSISGASSLSSTDGADLAAIFARAVQQEAAEVMLAEKRRLEECLATSGLTKGLYLKRCNGEYRNALDDVLGGTHGDSDKAPVKEDSSTDKVVVKDPSIGQTPVKEKSSTDSAPVKEKSSTQPSAGPASSPADIPEMANPNSTDYGYAILGDKALPSVFSRLTVASSPKAQDDDDTDAKAGSKMSRMSFPKPEKLKFTSDMLKNREAMVRNGAVDDHNLCYTYWTFHRLAKRAEIPA